MSELENGPTVTLRVLAPGVLAAGTASNPDPRTAEVLRALQRAKGTVNATPRTPQPAGDDPAAILALRETLSTTNAATQEAAQSLVSSVRVLESVVGAAATKLADLQRSQERAVGELREVAQALKRQADTRATWQGRWTRHLVAWGVFLALLVGSGIALSWRTHAVALRTHAVLDQILENQARAQAAKSGKRR